MIKPYLKEGTGVPWLRALPLLFGDARRPAQRDGDPLPVGGGGSLERASQVGGGAGGLGVRPPGVSWVRRARVPRAASAGGQGQGADPGITSGRHEVLARSEFFQITGLIRSHLSLCFGRDRRRDRFWHFIRRALHNNAPVDHRLTQDQ